MIRTKTRIKGPMGWIDCVCCEKLKRDFVARTFALIAPVHPDLLRVSCCYETVPNAPKHYATHQNMSLGFNGVDWVRSLRKIPTWLRGTNFWLITPVHTVLHWVWCSYKTIPNAPKHYETHQNMSLRSNVVVQVLSLRKITTWLRGTNFCINWTSSVCLAPSFMQLRNDPKCTQILLNAPKHYFWVQWGGLGPCEKTRRDFVAWTFALIGPVHSVFHRVSCSYETIPNAPKHYETRQNMSLKSNVVDQVRWCEKLQRDFLARTFTLIEPVQYV